MKKAPTLTPEQMQQHPEVAALVFLLGMLFLVLFVGALAVWALCVWKINRGEKLLVPEPWRPRPWGLIDILLVMAMVVVGQVLAVRTWSALTGVRLAEMEPGTPPPLSLMAAVSGSYLVVMFFSVLAIAFRHGVSPAEVGFTARRFLRHAGIGLLAGMGTLPIVYAVMLVASLGLDKEYEHPLLEGVGAGGGLEAYLLAVFSAVIAAPIVEEFFFRVLLQGWLQSLPWQVRDWSWFWGGVPTVAPAAETPQAVAENPYQPVAHTLPPVDDGQQPTVSSTPVTPPLWPIFVSGTLFGFAHMSYGVSFIPLTLMGIIMGWLYRSTHSIWPSLIVHLMLNALSMLALGVFLLMSRIAG
jgi:membrane protease YdiL (CAAX protease family)